MSGSNVFAITGWTQSGTLFFEGVTSNTWSHTSFSTVYVQQGWRVLTTATHLPKLCVSVVYAAKGENDARCGH
jgi:hypothetical protein